MKIETYSFPRSSFLAVEKDAELIVSQMIKNDRLMKLLFYPVKNALDQGPVPEQYIFKGGPAPWQQQDENTTILQPVIGGNIKLLNKLLVDREVMNYLNISFDSFTPNASNPEFRDSLVCFDIVCHIGNWNLGNFALRPYKIAAEIDSMFNNKHLTGIGTLDFVGTGQIVLSDEYQGLAMIYQAIHGYKGEDSKYPLNPKEQQDIINNWNQIFNNQDNGL